MSTLRPRNRCWIRRRTEKYDGQGRPIHSTRSQKSRCAIVWLYGAEDKTTVRADSSASRGRAEETLADARLLFLPTTDINLGDVVEVQVKGGSNVKVEVKRIFRRPDVAGVIHHIDVEGEIWVQG